MNYKQIKKSLFENWFYFLIVLILIIFSFFSGMILGVHWIITESSNAVGKALSMTNPQFILNVNETKMSEEIYKVLQYSNLTK